MPKKTVSSKIRAAAIADLTAGEQPAVVAQRYGLEDSTVRVWKVRYVTDVVALRNDATALQKPSIQAQHHAIGELILDLLAAKLKASTAIAQAASDPAWQAKQTGTDLATLGEWLDTTAFAIGDRLAGGRRTADDGEPPAS